MSDLMKYRDPFIAFDGIRKAFDQAFSDTPEFFRSSPDVDIKKKDDRYIVEADLPGMSENDIDVRVEDNSLIISSEKAEEKKEKDDEGYLVRERRRRAFKRRFSLPTDVDQEQIDANFKNGVLTLNITRIEGEKNNPKKIEVKTS